MFSLAHFVYVTSKKEINYGIGVFRQIKRVLKGRKREEGMVVFGFTFVGSVYFPSGRATT